MENGMPSIGFNAINEIAREQLRQEEIEIIHRGTMWDVISPDDYRIWKNPETKVYYYMFRDKGRVYSAWNQTFLDYMTTPPTQHVRCVLMPVDDGLQGSIRDVLLAYPPDMWITEGGVLK